MTLDLSLLLEPPGWDARGVLTIEALAPLSMVTSMPGKYYRSQPAPTDAMLYGMLENALGWHISDGERKELFKRLAKNHEGKPTATDVGYASLLQFHLRFTTQFIPALLSYDDLWAQHLKSEGKNFIGGSRNYDKRVIRLMNALASEQIKVDERADYSKSSTKVEDFNKGDTIHVSVLRPHFPQYFVSPKSREYVIPQGSYKFAVTTSASLAQILNSAIEDPAAPLYLGSSDGWIEVSWETL